VVAETLRAGDTFGDWAGRYVVRGKRLHKLRILATAPSAGIHALVTSHDKDFADPPPLPVIRLSGIELS
jgi:hypothetical protein